MMNFIVLGLIPGTHIQLNFAAYLLVVFAVVVVLGVELRRMLKQHRLAQRRDFDIISLRSLEQA